MTRQNNRNTKLTHTDKTKNVMLLDETNEKNVLKINDKEKNKLMKSSCSLAMPRPNGLQNITGNKMRKKKKGSKKKEVDTVDTVDAIDAIDSIDAIDAVGAVDAGVESGCDKGIGSNHFINALNSHSNKNSNNREKIDYDHVTNKKKEEGKAILCHLQNNIELVKPSKEEINLRCNEEKEAHNNTVLLRSNNSWRGDHILNCKFKNMKKLSNGEASLRSSVHTCKGKKSSRRDDNCADNQGNVLCGTKNKVILDGSVKIVKTEMREYVVENGVEDQEKNAIEMEDAEENAIEMEDAEKNAIEMEDAEKNAIEMEDAEEKAIEMEDAEEKASYEGRAHELGPHCSTRKSEDGELTKEDTTHQHEKYKRRKKKNKIKKKVKSSLFKKSVLYSNYGGHDILNVLNQTKLSLSFYQREVDDFLSVIRNLQNIVLIEREKYTELKEMLKYTTEEIEKENSRLYEEVHFYKQKYNKLRSVISNIGYGILFNTHKKEMPTYINNAYMNFEKLYADERNDEYSTQPNEYDYVMVNKNLGLTNHSGSKNRPVKRERRGNYSSLLKYIDF
ncbi:hypothetical protein, conserved [Plasmodium gonderi]|uniref:Uncharacterized protein n=1 Tax=Plasmodium gonderi TaxID=77519 RepID=A0A1Y1JHJ1_PLAGO|nr:hypothetical protein, conserved [Plasmodium gonderi]GAW81991.1 hypothetical protein, conserved [Plasmodium gonderi]